MPKPFTLYFCQSCKRMWSCLRTVQPFDGCDHTHLYEAEAWWAQDVSAVVVPVHEITEETP